MTKRATSRPTIDWLKVRAAYERGGLSDRALARKHGVTPPAIRYRSAKEGWVKPTLGPQAVAVPSRVPGRTRPAASQQTRPVATPAAARAPVPIEISVSPSLAAAVTAEPVDLVVFGRGLTGRLFDELDATTTYRGQLEDLIINETAGDLDGRRRQAMLKAVGLPTRAAVLKNLALATRILADAAPGKKATAEQLAKKAGSGRFGVPAAPKLVVNNT